MLHVNWRTSITIPKDSGLIHGIIIEDTDVIIIWVAGSTNAWELNSYTLHNVNGVSVTINKTMGAVTASRNTNSTWTYIGT